VNRGRQNLLLYMRDAGRKRAFVTRYRPWWDK